LDGLLPCAIFLLLGLLVSVLFASVPGSWQRVRDGTTSRCPLTGEVHLRKAATRTRPLDDEAQSTASGSVLNVALFQAKQSIARFLVQTIDQRQAWLVGSETMDDSHFSFGVLDLAQKQF
jgi:hypothetical protein